MEVQHRFCSIPLPSSRHDNIYVCGWFYCLARSGKIAKYGVHFPCISAHTRMHKQSVKFSVGKLGRSFYQRSFVVLQASTQIRCYDVARWCNDRMRRWCACVLRDSMKQLFMRRVHAEKTWISRLLGSRAKQFLLGLCAARVIYPVSITNCFILSRRERAHMYKCRERAHIHRRLFEKIRVY